jgi:hypothetical protein
MRELVSEIRECNVCGSRVRVVCGASDVGMRGVTFVESFEGRLVRATRERSGLAHAAGFAGVLYLFGYSVGPFAMARWWFTWWGPSLLFTWSLFAPLALALAFAAGVSLDRSREKAGAMPALFGLVAGILGTAKLLALAALWLKYLHVF